MTTPHAEASTTPSERMKIAYLTPQYPKVSHSFIRREILELEARGHTVFRFSVRSPEAQVVDASDRAEQTNTTVLLDAPLSLLTAALSQFLQSPVATLRTAFLSLVNGFRCGNGIVRPIAYFLEACFIKARLEALEAQHLHVHFGTNAATVAMIARRLGGPPFSMTIHGPDEWDGIEKHQIPEKLREAAFTAVVSSFGAGQAMRWTSAHDWSRIEIVHCNVDESFLGAVEPIASGDALRLVCVGRLTAQKGQMLLIDAFAGLLDGGVEAQLVLAGDGEMRAEVEARSRLVHYSLSQRRRALALALTRLSVHYVPASRIRAVRLVHESNIQVQP